MGEYVKFSVPEKTYGQKNILHGELEVLSILKRIKLYKKLRREELVLRLSFKKKVGDVLENLKVLDKQLPHSKMAGLKKKVAKEDIEENNENLTLEQEIESIRMKLEKLQG